ncbi:MAG: hypothetical protein ACHQRM_17510 [Bacteroidia bacterium]
MKQTSVFKLKFRHFAYLLLLPLLTLFSTRASAGQRCVVEMKESFYHHKPGPTVSHYHPKLVQREKTKKLKSKAKRCRVKF